MANPARKITTGDLLLNDTIAESSSASHGTQDDDILIFADEEEPNQADVPCQCHEHPWLVLIVDDDPETHQVTKLAMSGVTYANRPLQFISAYSAQEAKQCLQTQPDIAAILLDVIMETEDAGLQVVEYIRKTLGNEQMQIILRTGQPGQVPEQFVIRDYDINDYRTKTELTAQKLVTSVITALRVFSALQARDNYAQQLQGFNQTLEQEVKNRTNQLEQALHELRLLLEMSQAINQAIDFEAALAVALLKVCEATGWEYGEAWIPTVDYAALYRSPIWHCHSQSETALARDVEAFRQQYHSVLLAPGDGLAGMVWQDECSHWVTYLSGEASNESDIIQCGFQSAFGVPIIATFPRLEPSRSEQKVLAVLVFYMADVHPQDHQSTMLISAVTTQLGTVMQQKQAEAELRALFAAMTDLIIVFDSHGRCLDVARTGAELLLQPISQLINRNVCDVLPRDKAEIYLLCIRQSLNEQRTISVEYSLRLENNDVWFSANVSPLSDQTVLWVARDITDLKQAEARLQLANEELKRLATLDGLTQVANRRYFDDRLQHEWRRMVRDRNPLCLILCDVDYFKPYNDHYGHQTGDDCLRQVALAIKRTVHRASDLVARYGGEEFAIILPNTTAEGGYWVAEAIRRAILALNIPHARSSVDTVITLSSGVASTIPKDNVSPISLLMDADQALYMAKNLGRNRSVCPGLVIEPI